MSYEFHPRLTVPPDDTVVWRFMDFPKFLQLLETSSLWFSRADVFEDPFEASFTDGELAHLTSQGGAAAEQHIQRAMLPMAAYMQTTSFVNCWRGGRDESMAMWDLYGKASGSVAIKSTLGRLKRIAESAAQKIFIGQVRYIDWQEAPFDNNLVVMSVRKGLSYRHESEIRLLIWAVQDQSLVPPEIDGTQEQGLLALKRKLPLGISVGIDLRESITEIMVGPREPEWMAKLITNVVRRYGLPQTVMTSRLLRTRAL